MNDHSGNRLITQASRLQCAALLLIVMAPLAASLGCGGKQPVDERRTSISGVVTYNGEPLKGGTVTFQSTEKALSSATALGQDGRYMTSRAPRGHCVVTIDTESLKFGSPHLFVKIPEKYGSPATSGLEVDVKEGDNENVDFDLK